MLQAMDHTQAAEDRVVDDDVVWQKRGEREGCLDDEVDNRCFQELAGEKWRLPTVGRCLGVVIG